MILRVYVAVWLIGTLSIVLVLLLQHKITQSESDSFFRWKRRKKAISLMSLV